MSNEELKQMIAAQFPTVAFEDGGEFVNVVAEAPELRSLMEFLRKNPVLEFDYLSCLSAVDWKTHFFVVYHLLARKDKTTLVVKAKINDRNNAEVHTVYDIWRGAEMHEREAYDLMGIKFTGHPDLRRLFLEDGWGFPLRKDYQDDVTIVSL